MARQKTQVEYNNFTNGFITEASHLTFPENASIDEENMNINRDGSRQRRFGLTWQNPVKLITTTGATLASSGSATGNFTWKSAGNDGTQNLGVLQLGRVLHFFDVDAEVPANTYITSSTFSAGEVPDDTEPFDITSAYGKLIVVVGTTTVYTFSWDGAVLTRDSYNLKIRDRFGIDDSLAVDSRPAALSDSHNYNLRNQGWPTSITCAGSDDGTVAATTANPITYTDTKLTVFPSNADLIWSAKLGSVDTTAGLVENIDAYSPWDLEKQIFGTTPAPQGKFIIDLFARGASRITESGVSGLLADTTSGGVTAIGAFAGRVWYAVSETGLTSGDDNSPNLGNMVLYSQASADFARWKSCHTRNDQTAEDFNDVLASDGGFISIPESGQIYKLVPLGESLFVFTSNGVWEIFGGDTGFAADTQSILKVTDIGALAERPIVSGDNNISYWAESGIYAITLDETSLRGVAINLTENTIQSYYDDIPIALKKQARGIYDPIAKQAVWLFNLTAKDSEYYFDKELILDVNKSSFTKRSFSPITQTVGSGPYPTTHLRLRNLVQGSQIEDVTDSAVVVTDGGVDVTITLSDLEQKTKTSIMYWCAHTANDTDENFRLGGYLDFNFLDWVNIQGSDSNFGIDFPAFILTGYLTGGDSSRDKWIPYLYAKLLRTESDWSEDPVTGVITMNDESGCFLQTQWDWSSNVLSGKWSTSRQVYRLPRFVAIDPSHIFSFDVVNTRNKIRGYGEALSLLFSSEAGKDMHILGWGIEAAIEPSF